MLQLSLYLNLDIISINLHICLFLRIKFENELITPHVPMLTDFYSRVVVS